MTDDEAPEPSPLEFLLRVAGAVVVTAAAALFAVIEAFLVPFKVGDAYIPLAAVVAAVGNLTLPELSMWLSRMRSLAMLPGLVWFIVVIAAAMPTAEGDLVIHDIWPGMALLLAGATTVAISGYRVVTSHRDSAAMKS